MKIVVRVAKDGKQMAKSLMEECILALGDAVCAPDKRLGLKIVGKPCEGKPHVLTFVGNECCWVGPKTAPAVYSTR